MIVPTGLTRQITLWSEKTNQAPTPRMGRPDGRIESLDALRGFAIFGILLINIQVFSGYAFIAGEGRSGLAWATWDEPLNRVLDVLVLANLQPVLTAVAATASRCWRTKVGDGAVRLHLRRMAGLLVIGLAHSILLWPWDILLLYALVGLISGRMSSPLTGHPSFAWAMALLAAVAVMTAYGPALGLPQGRGAYATQVLQDSVPALAGALSGGTSRQSESDHQCIRRMDSGTAADAGAGDVSPRSSRRPHAAAAPRLCASLDSVGCRFDRAVARSAARHCRVHDGT